MLSLAYSMVFHNEQEGSSFSHPSPSRFIFSKEGGGEMQVTVKMERLGEGIGKILMMIIIKPQLHEVRQLLLSPFYTQNSEALEKVTCPRSRD